jgi:enterochelin esterase-like enzyme
VERFEKFPSRFVDARTVDVWLPDAYDGNKKFAVLYMHDGAMLFDTSNTWNHQEWGVDETMGPLMASGTIRNTIVVGVWNNTTKRHIEYFPQKAFFMLPDSVQEYMIEIDARQLQAPPDVRPISDAYLRFLVSELKPFVDSAYATLTDRGNTFIAGSSMGGLISMYAICEYPDVFGGAACFSTHWPGNGWGAQSPIPAGFMRYMNKYLPPPENHRIYFDYGTETLDAVYKPFQQQADAVMRAKGYTEKNWMTKEFVGDDHSERSWKKRFAIPMIFLLGR